MKDDRLYLIHIVECIEKIERFSSDGKEAFFADDRTQDAVLRNLQLVGESAKRLSADARSEHPEEYWRSVIGLRNILVHEYLGVNLERVWQVIVRDLPVLKSNLKAMLYKLELKD